MKKRDEKFTNTLSETHTGGVREANHKNKIGIGAAGCSQLGPLKIRMYTSDAWTFINDATMVTNCEYDCSTRCPIQ